MTAPLGLSKIRVELDVLNGAIFEAQSRGGQWNGWAEPLFSLDESRRIVQAFNGRPGGTKAIYDSRRDVFIFEDEEGETEEFGSIVIQGRKLYPIGTAIWCWSELPSAEPHGSEIRT